MANDGLAIKIVNILAYIFLLGSNSYAAVDPSYGGSIEAGKITYITPASYAFFIWTLINLLLLGELVLQFFGSAQDLVVNHIGWRFALVAVINAVYVHLYASGHYVLAFIAVLFLASSISTVYWSLRSHAPKDLGQSLFVFLPWSLWHSWSVVLTIVTLFAAFGKGTDQHAGFWTRILVPVALAFLSLTAVGYAFDGKQGDVAGAIAIAWALWGVFSAVNHPAIIHYFALGSAVVATVAVVKALLTTYRGGVIQGDSERAPLLSSE